MRVCDAMRALNYYVLPQMVLTLFLVALLWSFHARLRRQAFFWWWACAWTSFALFLVLAALRLQLPRDWTLARNGVALLMMLSGFLQIPLLVFGARSLQRPELPTRRWKFAWIGLAIAAGVGSFALSVLWRDQPLGSFALRNVIRMLGLAGALFFCAAVFFRRSRATRSWATGVTGGFCLLYGMDQSIYTVTLISRLASPDALIRRFLDPAVVVRSPFFLIDLVASCGICLGMVLLLLDEHQRAERALLESLTRGDEIAERNAALQAEIAERRRVERALRDAEARNSAMVRALPDLMFLTSSDGVFLDYHARDRRHLLVPPEEFLGRRVREVLPSDLANGLERCFGEALASDEPSSFEYSVPVNGETRFYEARIVRCDADKLLSVVRDITERTRAEDEARELRDELAHVGRVSVIGALTGSLAHEINQPLAAISINAAAALNIFAHAKPDVAELRQTMHDIIADSQRAGDVLHRLRTLLVRGTTEHALLDVKTLIEEVLRLVHGELVARRIGLEVSLDGDAPQVLGDRVQLQQVVLNLLINAFEAVRDLEVAERRVQLRTAQVGGDVVVSVEDHGSGLHDDQLGQIFEPFYTTKHDGMGLGLAICKAIVTAHGGTLTVERNSGRGLTASFRLAAARPSRKDESAPDSLEALRVM
jgi:PAS domain S-box-containing protein